HFLALCSCLLTLSCEGAKKIEPSPSASQPVVWEPAQLHPVVPAGVRELTTRLPDGMIVRYTISVPEGYDPKKPVPLVIALHYAGRVEPFYGHGILDGLVGPAFAGLGAIVVAPDA